MVEEAELALPLALVLQYHVQPCRLKAVALLHAVEIILKEVPGLTLGPEEEPVGLHDRRCANLDPEVRHHLHLAVVGAFPQPAQHLVLIVVLGLLFLGEEAADPGQLLEDRWPQAELYLVI